MNEKHNLFEAGLFTRKVIGNYAVYDDSLLFRAGVFPERIVNGKQLEVTKKNLKSVVDTFAGPIPGNVQHSEFLKGKALHILNLWQVGDELKGTVAVPLWLDEHLDESHKKLSIELEPTTFNSIVGVAICTNPRVTDASLMAAFSEFSSKKTPHTTYHGQSSLQHIHDQAARSGAICVDDDKESGKMTSKPESKHFQKIHDEAVSGGASCSNAGYGYYTFSSEPLECPVDASRSHTQTSETITQVNTLPNEIKDKKRMKLSDFIAWVQGKETIENDLVEGNGDFKIPVTEPKVDVTKTVEFQAEVDKTKKLEDQLKAIEDENAAKFTKDNEDKIDALIVIGKIEPKDKEVMLAKRATNFSIFDELMEMIPVKPEFVNTNVPTVPADQIRDQMDKAKPGTSQALELNKKYISGLGAGL